MRAISMAQEEGVQGEPHHPCLPYLRAASSKRMLTTRKAAATIAWSIKKRGNVTKSAPTARGSTRMATYQLMDGPHSKWTHVPVGMKLRARRALPDPQFEGGRKRRAVRQQSSYR